MLNIALNTFREIVRNKLFSVIAFLSVILIGLSFVVDTLALGETERVMTDFGLSFIELSGLAIILFLGGGLITREIEGKTIYLLLSKPIARNKIIFGKFIGFTLVLILALLIETTILIAILWLHHTSFGVIFFMSIVGIFLKLISMLSVILFFSTIVSPGLSVFLTLAIYMIGHGGYAMLEYALRNGNTTYSLVAKGVLAIFPNLESLNLKNLVATTATIHTDTYLIAFGLSLMYTLIVLVLAALIFSRRSFNAV